MTTLNLDFETRSIVDLKRCGVHVYARHKYTDVWCMAWAIDDMEPDIWTMGQPIPRLVLDAVRDKDVQFRAWNAQFERTIWREIMAGRHGWPALALERWYCTMADASAMALPRALEQAAEVLHVTEQKDMAAWRLIIRMSRPRKMVNGVPIWWDDADRLAVMYDYCKQDVRTEKAIARCTRRLLPAEREIYLLDQKINDRGVLLDIPLIHGMQRITDIGLERANAEIRAASEGAVKGVTDTAGMRSFLEVDSVKKSAIRELLEGSQPTPQRIVIEQRAEAGRSSIAKLESALKVRGHDDRARGMLMYYGANTGRWAGRTLQPHNFPRGTDVVDAQTFIPYLRKGDEESYNFIDMFYPPIHVVSASLRGMFIAGPGNVLRVADFAGIEARVLAWIARQTDLVTAFRSGAKIYEEMAGLIYDADPASIAKDDPRRQIGKNTVLGCGYGLGGKTFKTTVKEQEGVDIPLDLAQRAVDAYRMRYPAIVTFWRDVNSAALTAVEYPGQRAEVNGCRFIVKGGYLYLVLPSGHLLCYARPKIEERMTPWNEMRAVVTAESLDNYTRKWTRRAYYGGLWTENIVQSLARDLLAASMLRVEERGYTTILTVHDEIVTEDAKSHGSLAEFLELMATVPAWARGCPVAATGYEAERYRK